ncbi:hypothetical protein ACU4GR_16560 [Methylobacterium oryzae CBMB20]
MPDLDALAGSAARALAYLPWWAESLILIVACCAVVMPLHGVVLSSDEAGAWRARACSGARWSRAPAGPAASA